MGDEKDNVVNFVINSVYSSLTGYFNSGWTFFNSNNQDSNDGLVESNDVVPLEDIVIQQ